MKKITSIFLFGFSLISQAENSPATPEQEKALQSARQAYFKSQGLNLPTEGAQVVPNQSIQLPPELKKQILLNQQTLLKQGYVENQNQRISELRDIHHTAVYEKQKYSGFIYKK